MSESLHLGRIAGVRIGAHWSLLVVFWLIAWTLADGELPHAAAGYSTGAYWAAGVVTAVAFYVGLLAHELAHAVAARRRGIEVEGIVLWLFGGVSQLEGEATVPADELRIAVVGPATSVAVALACLGLTRGVSAGGWSPLLAAALGWLGWINGILGVFNLMPAFPLDGGRVLRAYLWRRRGDRAWATERAARVGRAFGYGIIGVGLIEFAAGGGLGGLWLVFLGWFLLAAAGAEAAASMLDAQLGGVRVGQVMTAAPLVAPAWLTIEDFLRTWVYPSHCSSFPLVGPDGDLVGLTTLKRIKHVPPSARSTMSIGQAACPLDDLVVCGPDEALVPVVQRMNASPDHRAVVVAGGRVVGILTPSDVNRALERAGLGSPPGSRV